MKRSFLRTLVLAALSWFCLLLLVDCSPREKPTLKYDASGQMVLVPGGIVQTGSRTDGVAETNVYEQELSPYWIGVKEVSEKDYAAFRKVPLGTGDLPVSDVSWYDAVEYCNWLSSQQGLTKVYELRQKTVTCDWSADGYRLPTEAEWENAARGGPYSLHTDFPGSNSVAEVAHFAANPKGKFPRATLGANELGLYDMAGNVAEWVWDFYGMYPVQPQKNYHGAENGEYRATRGSSWDDVETQMRVSDRSFQAPEARLPTMGFRLARTAIGADAKAISVAKAAPLASPPSDARYKNALQAVPDRVDDLLGRMSLDEKLGQMTQIAFGFLSGTAAVGELGLGSVLSGGDMQPGNGSPEDWAALVDAYQGAALGTRLGIPILFGIDSVHGAAKVRGATIFPHNIGLGAANDPVLMERMGAVVAQEMRASGLTWNFAPCVAVARDERWGRTYESFGAQPELSSRLGSALIRGLQGSVLGPNSVAATAKHFLADGGTSGGVDRGNAVMPEKELRRLHLPPYVAAIQADTACIMVSYSSWNDVPMHGNKKLLTDVLRNELGFHGVLISDWGGQTRLPGNAKQQVKAMVLAGVDVCMVPDDIGPNGFTATLKGLVLAGEVPQTRIDQAVRRILTLKFNLGLFEHPFAPKQPGSLVGDAVHRQIARQLVAKSVVLLKNEKVLPLTAKKILVTGTLADNLDAQCGGWTMGWQQPEGEIAGATTIKSAILAEAKAKGIIVVTAPEAEADSRNPTLAIVIAGERPYAEFEGDNQNPSLSPADRKTIQSLKKQGLRVLLVLLSGRPLLITDLLPDLDGLVAAWLPGSEGEGVADVLFGDTSPTGRLPMSWPQSQEQLPLNPGDGKAPLFDFGFGMSL